MKVSVLYSRATNYLVACLRALVGRGERIQLQLFRWPPSDNAPYDVRVSDIVVEQHIKGDQSAADIEERVRTFGPDALIMSGWIDKEYLKVARAVKAEGVPIIAGCDTQWTGSIRQRLGQLASPWYLKSAIDVLWVPGERQRQLAAKMGYNGGQCWTGYYSCNWDRFAKVHKNSTPDRKGFLFVGRYVREKGLDVLVSAYKQYRERAEQPWELITAGEGAFGRRLKEERHIHNQGFIGEKEVASLLGQAGALVLPSRFEPWGVVIHEAAAAGLPVICSRACGAGVHLVQHGYNGYQTKTGCADSLTKYMLRLSGNGSGERRRMGERGHELSKQFTPARWAETFLRGVSPLCNDSGDHGE